VVDKITYDALYELVRREKQKDELQQLEPEYLALVLAYLRELDNRLLVTDKQGMFGQSDHEQLAAQQRNARKLIRELYERREKKLSEIALNKSCTGSDLIDTSNLLSSEKALFDMLVGALDAYRRGILHNIISLREPEQLLLGSQVIDTALLSGRISDSGMMLESRKPMGGTTGKSAGEMSEAEKKAMPDELAVTGAAGAASDTVSVAAGAVGAAAGVIGTEGAAVVAQEAKSMSPAKPGMRRVCFVSAVDQFVGQELELYGPFQPGDEAELPVAVADILLSQGSVVAK
jgi:DNA replication initiation complex subunit (GINS family)